METTMRMINNSGLTSEKNICFANTAIQLMCNIPSMKNFFIKKEYRLKDEHQRSMQVFDELSRLLNIEGAITTSASELRRLVGTRSRTTHLKDGSQQDVLESFLTLIE